MLPEILKWLEHAYSLKATEYVIMENRSRARQLTWDLTRNQLFDNDDVTIGESGQLFPQNFESFAKTL
jgi:hypothetical protein